MNRHLKIISHRGNLKGPDPINENKLDYVQAALDAGFDVEIDLWYENDTLYLGHDYGQYKVDVKFLKSNRAFLWIHSKNLEALHYMCNNLPHLNFFWHQDDKFTLTSTKKIWTYPNNDVTNNSVIVIDNESESESTHDKYIKSDAYGICTDYPQQLFNRKKIIVREQDYKEYVHDCISIEEDILSFPEFNVEIESGKCKTCIMFDNPTCSCKTKTTN